VRLEKPRKQKKNCLGSFRAGDIRDKSLRTGEEDLARPGLVGHKGEKQELRAETQKENKPGLRDEGGNNVGRSKGKKKTRIHRGRQGKGRRWRANKGQVYIFQYNEKNKEMFWKIGTTGTGRKRIDERGY